MATASSPADSSPWQISRWHSDLVIVPNTSRKIHAAVCGKARSDSSRKQPLVVIAAGLGGVAAEHILVAQLLAPFVRVLRFDRAGYGSSTRDPDHAENDAQSYAVESTVKDLIAVLGAIELDPPYILIGHSFGGIFIREFLTQMTAEKVVGMVLVDANPNLERKKFDDIDKLIEKLCKGSTYQEVIELTRNTILSPTQVSDVDRDRSTARKNGTIEGEATMADHSVKTCAERQGMRIIEKDHKDTAVDISFSETPLGTGRMSIIIGGFPDDLEKAVENGKKGGAVDENTLIIAEDLLNQAKNTWGKFLGAQGQLTEGEVRVVQAEGAGRTHNLHMTRPDIVAEEVRWVLKGTGYFDADGIWIEIR